MSSIVQRRAPRPEDHAYDGKSVRLSCGDVSNCRVVQDSSELQKAQRMLFAKFLQDRVPPEATLHEPRARHDKFTFKVSFPQDAVVNHDYAPDHKRHFPHAYVERKGTADVWSLPYVQSAHPTCTKALALVLLLVVMGLVCAVLYAVLAL